MTARIRALNSVGIDRFSAWIDNPVGQAPTELLLDPASSEEIDDEYFFDADRAFDTSYDLGVYLHQEVFPKVTNRFALNSNRGMWAWLSLAFIGQLLPRSGKNAGKPLAKAHYVDTGPRLAYRLITRTAWNLVKLHGQYARLALSSKATPWGEMAEQMSNAQEVFVHPRVWPVAYQLYTDSHGQVRRGATTQRDKKAKRDPNNKRGLGGVRRLPRTFKQFDRTYNTREMPPEEILSLLPTEYRRWR